MSDSVQPHRQQPGSPVPGILQERTRVGCHFLLQCMKVKSESEVAQSCPTLSDPMDCSPPGSSIHGIFQARELEWGVPIAFSGYNHRDRGKIRNQLIKWLTLQVRKLRLINYYNGHLSNTWHLVLQICLYHYIIDICQNEYAYLFIEMLTLFSTILFSSKKKRTFFVY